ncbi:hypothetical protein SAMN05421812_103172 [Asanoa hainanensis]|uniref:Uncharacterized protein n=1 Tax=Asanoa hainanensis TaxID=560556 RepID=A0A239JWK8_9ACTN|nr:hypothetical protein [Asanoa hainanensis]SNT10317.1 hypothetical protein SAMN05421812_103172 [Asanoa hainanensis]
MRWRPALALAASAVGVALLSGAGPAWADQPASAGRSQPGVALSPASPPSPPASPEQASPPPSTGTGTATDPPGTGTNPPGPPPPDADSTPADDLRLDKTPVPPPPPPVGLRSGQRNVRQGLAGGVVEAVLRVATDSAVRVVDRKDDVLPTGTAVVSATGPSVPGTGGGGDDGTDPKATGMAVGIVLLVGVGLMAAGVALVGLRNRRDMADHSH